jgi:uncharacterized iron-regulated membrane protein
MQASLKRTLYLLHRWLGLVLCAFFALWFVSGIFMMYVEYPQLTLPERLAGLPPLDFAPANVAPGEAVAALRAGDFATIGTPHGNRTASIEDPAAPADVERVRLGMLHGRPVYYVHARGGTQPITIDAETGALLGRIDAATALAVAREFAARRGEDVARIRYAVEVQTDQWSLTSALDAHRPLHLIALEDAAGTELYVSSVTGEVVRDSRRIERWLNYPAAVTHWLYPTLIRQYPEAWAQMVKVLSGVGVVLALTGLIIGLQRYRWRAVRGASKVPYRGWMRWHHIAGLVFGLAVLTWVLSGLLSMNPGGINPSRSPTPEQHLVFTGKPLTPDDFMLDALQRADSGVVDAELLHYQGGAFYLTTARDGSERLLPANGIAGRLPSVDTLRARAEALLPEAPLLRATVLDTYDDYWYSRHPERGGRVLPVLRLEFGDAASTWFHADPATGRLLEKSTRFNRVYRWLYNGLHSFDILWLWERRPLWDIAVILFSLGGFALSMSGVVISVRYLRFEAKKSQLRAAAAQRASEVVAG